MKKAFLLMAVLLFVAACTKPNTTTTTTGNTVDAIPLNKPVAADRQVMVKNNDITVAGNAGSGAWCDKNADWSWIAPGEGSAKWDVVGLETSGKYAGLCHIVYEVQSDDGTTQMNYYINENEDSGYLDMVMPNGQTFTQSWSN
jgi:hypothetical protein